MTKPTILVTGATGKTGSAVVAQLCERRWPVRAVVRSRDARSERLEQLGAEIVLADMFDYDAIRSALAGTSRAYYCPPFHPHMLQSAVTFALAARDAKLESIVGLTQWLASPSHPSHSTRQHWLADRLFALLPDVGLTIVNPGLFADSPYLALMRYAALLGVFPMPAQGTSYNAPPSTDDIARVAVGALLDPETHAGKTYRPTGPELLSLNDIVAIIGDVLGRRVRHVPLPLPLFLKAARLDGYESFSLIAFGDYMHELNTGTFALGAPTDDVLNVTGRAAESFETVARRHAALPQARRTVLNVARALADFMTVPFRSGLDPERYAERLRLPAAPAPLYDLESERWRLDHTRHRSLPLSALEVVRTRSASSEETVSCN